MPTYDYRCNACKHLFEAFQSITATPLKECPNCGAEVERLIGAGMGLIFKGSGFYITDYKKSKTSAAGGNDSSPSKNEENKPAAKSEESKPAPTSTEKSDKAAA